MAMSKLELLRSSHEGPIPKKVKELKELVVGSRPVTTRISWRESLRTQETERTLTVAAKSHLVNSIDEGAFEIIEERLDCSLDRDDLRSIFDAAKKKRTRILPSRPLATGGQIEMRTLDGDEAASTLFDPEIDPEVLKKTGIVIGSDTLLSKVYEYENWPGMGSRSFTEAIIDGREVPLWKRQWGEIFPRPPQEVFKEPLSRLQPGETIQLISGRRDLLMNLTALPLKRDVHMPEFVLAIDQQKALIGDSIDDARKEGLSIIWIVDHAHEGLLEAAFWENVKGGRRPLLDILLRRSKPARYRLFRRSQGGWLFGIDGAREKGRWIPEEPVPGCVNLLIEGYDGKLEKVYEDYMEDFAERVRDPNSEDRRIRGIATLGLADIRQTGTSLGGINAVEVEQVTSAPPMLATFKSA